MKPESIIQIFFRKVKSFIKYKNKQNSINKEIEKELKIKNKMCLRAQFTKMIRKNFHLYNRKE